MNLQTFQDRFPRLYRLLNSVGMDAELSFKDEINLEEGKLSRLEYDAGSLDDSEYDLMATGEEEERRKLISKRNLQDLDFFLNQCFDGELTPEVFE